MEITARRFGAPPREMVGVCQHPATEDDTGPGVLLCRPFGQESTRTAAMYRVISERLARQGCTVLRFDYHGTSDSPGEEGDQSISAWTGDVVTAQAALALAGGRLECWFGMGLGANIALRAAEQSPRPPDRLVLWEPVLDGATYTDALLAGHRAELEREFQAPWSTLLKQRKVSEPGLPGHVLGFEFGKTLADELRQLALGSLQPILARGVGVTCCLHEDQQRLMHNAPSDDGLRWHRIEGRTDWLASQAQGAAIVPPDVFAVLLDLVRRP